MTLSCAVNADAVPSSERNGKMAANEGGALARKVSAMLSAGGGVRRLVSLPGLGVGGRPLSGWPATRAACGCMLWIGIIAMFFTATWQRFRAGAEAL